MVTFKYKLWERLEDYDWPYQVDPQVIKILVDNSQLINEDHPWEYELSEHGYTLLGLFGPDQPMLSYLERLTTQCEILAVI